MSNESKYILTERIAQGGMAEIHLGKSVGTDGFARICAFKRILPHLANDSEFIQMFRNEAMVAKQLQNKNIVQVFDFVSDGQSYMLVMEYVDGQDLRAILMTSEATKRRIPTEIACYIVMEALAGLHGAHSQVDVSGKSMGIIHRDVSPQNILVSYDGDVKITDFGIAKAQNQTNTTRAGVLKGKFRYMSPEQARGEKIDARSDIFAAGVVLYEMLTMTRLFRGEDMAVLEAVRNCRVKAPSTVAGSHITEELDAIVLKLLANEPAKRYQTGKEAVKDLSRFLYGFRPDFFSGEVADFMKVLFLENMAAAKERLRSTLAIPSQDAHQFGGMISSPAAIGKALSPFSMGGAPVTVQPSSKKIELSVEPPKSKASDFMGHAQRFPQPKRTVGAIASKTPVPSKKYSPWRHISFAVVMIAVIAGGVFGYEKLNPGQFRSSVQILATPNDKIMVEVDGVKYASGALQTMPMRMSLPPGTSTVTLHRFGFKAKKLKIASPLFPQELRESAVLEKAGPTASLRFVTIPAGAKIVLEVAKHEIKTPAVFEYLPVNKPLVFKVSHPLCPPSLYKENLPDVAEGTIVVRTLRLRNCE